MTSSMSSYNTPDERAVGIRRLSRFQIRVVRVAQFQFRFTWTLWRGGLEEAPLTLPRRRGRRVSRSSL